MYVQNKKEGEVELGYIVTTLPCCLKDFEGLPMGFGGWKGKGGGTEISDFKELF